MTGSVLLLCLLVQLPAEAADGGVVGDTGVVVDAGGSGDAGVVVETASADSQPADAQAIVPPMARPALVPVTGVVLVRGSRDPVPAVGLTVDGQAGGETDGDGRFVLQLPAGRHLVQIQHPGYRLFSHVFDVPAGAAGREQLPSLTLRLESTRGPGEYETVIRPPPREAPQVSLEKSEITMTPGSLGDPFRVIESLPGVVPVMWPLPVYAVRGSNPGNTGYFLDGLRVPALFHFALGPAVIHPYFLETLTFFPSAYPAEYGRYVGGVVAAGTTTAPPDRARGSVDVRLFDAAGMLSTPINDGKGTVAAAARYCYPAAVLNPLQDEVDLQYWDYQARMDHTLGIGRFTLMALGSYDSLAVSSRPESSPVLPGQAPGETESETERVALTFHRVDLRWAAPLAGGRFVAALGAGFDRTSSPYEDGDLAVSGKSLLPRLLFERGLGAAVQLTVGADGELTDYDALAATLDPAMVLGALRARSAVLLGTHAGLVIRAGEDWVVSPGLRLDSYRESSTHQLDLQPRLHLRYQVAPRVWLKASGGRATQLPSIPLQIPGFEGFGLARHGLQTAWQGSAGAESPLPGRLELDVTGYIQRMRLTDILDIDAGDDPALADFLVNRQALSYGVELMIRRPPRERLHGWISYTLSEALRAFEGGIVSAADWDQRHVLNLVVGYRWSRYTLGGRFHLHTGRQVKVAESFPLDYARLSPFYQLDLRLDRRFVYDRYTLDLYLELVNATLTRQVVELRDAMPGRVEEGFRIVIPSLGLRAEF